MHCCHNLLNGLIFKTPESLKLTPSDQKSKRVQKGRQKTDIPSNFHISEVKHGVYSKRQKWNFFRLSSAVSTVE